MSDPQSAVRSTGKEHVRRHWAHGSNFPNLHELCMLDVLVLLPCRGVLPFRWARRAVRTLVTEVLLEPKIDVVQRHSAHTLTVQCAMEKLTTRCRKPHPDRKSTRLNSS